MSGAKKYIGLLGVITLLAVMFQPTAKAQSLQEFLQSAYDNHPELLYNARGLYQSFESRRSGAIDGLLPRVTYTETSSYTRRNYQPGNPPLQGNPNNVSVRSRFGRGQLRLQQNLFNSFGDVFEFRGFLNFAEALEFRYYQFEQIFLLEAIVAYLNVIRTKNIVGVQLANYESLQARLDIVQRLYDIGDTTELDLQQSRAQLLTAQSAWERALANYEGAVADFRRYAAIEPVDPAFADIPANMPVSKEDGEQQLSQGNFEVRYLELLQKANKLAYHATKAQQAGIRVDLNIDYNDDISTGGARGGASALQSSQHDTVTSLSATIPLYDPRVSPNIRGAHQAYLRSKNEYSRRKLANIQLFEDQWADFTRNAKAVEYQRQAAEAAQIALDNVVLQQRAGLRSIVEVLDEETRLINAQVQYENARFEHLRSAYQVQLYVGRLTAKDLGLQTTYGEQLAKYFEKHDGYWEAPGGYTAIKGLFVEEE